MLTCNDFPPGTRKRAICDGTIDWPLAKINKFRVQMEWEPLEEKPETAFAQRKATVICRNSPPMPGHTRPDSTSSLPRIKQPGSRLKEEFAKWHAEECPICSGLAAQMDAWGAAGCREHLKKIVVDITSRGKDWFAKHHPTTDKLFVLSRSQIVRDLAIGLTVKKLITKAITETEAEEAELKKKYIGRRDPAAVAGRFFEAMKKEQATLYAQNRKAAKPSPDPFRDLPVLHFGAHLWPIKDHWHWHVDLWNTLPDRINGRLIVFVAIDRKTVSFDEVRNRLHPAIEAIRVRNTPEGEVPSFRRLQQMIPAGNDDVLLYCHGKGVQDRTYKSPGVRAWTEAMYETVIFNHVEVIRRLGDGYKNFHSFRMFGGILGTAHKWHPSGTFFAVRAKHLQNKKVRPGYGGVEAWCGEYFAASESWCEIGDGVMFTDLYDYDRFQRIVGPELQAWRAKRKAKPDTRW
jgi:hypothetical protein